MKPYYDHNGITIYHGDCREVLPDMKQVEYLITDPPYGESFSSSWEGPYKGSQIKGDESTAVRDCVLEIWGEKPAIVFGTWRTPVTCAKQALVWDKGEAAGMGDLSIPWKPNFEMIFILGSGFSGKRSTGVLKGYTVVTWASKGRVHPNMKPESLMIELINKCPNGTIVDPFMGSGTTLVAAKQLGRKCIGIEMEEKYCEIAVKRLQQEYFDF